MEPFESRRRTLLSRLDKTVAVFCSAPVLTRNNTVEHDYRQDSDFYYLTGFDEPESVLVLSTVHPEHCSALFLRARNPEREQWEGTRLGFEEAPRKLGVDVAYSIDKLAEKLPEYLQNAQRLITRLGQQPSFDALLFEALGQTRAQWRNGISWPTEILDPLVSVHEMRLRKDPSEVELMRQAAHISAQAHTQAMRQTKPGQREYEIEALLSHIYRTNGSARHAYQPIVGSGPNATVLHYIRNDRQIEPSDLVLIDSGCEYGGYASDITRTYPASGQFSPEQKRIYEVVLRAQLEAIQMARPGNTVEAIHQRVCEVLLDGLLDLQLLSGPREQLLQDKAFRRFYPHRTSHWLGMDVHDVGRYFIDGKPRVLEPGMVITIEPGLYIPPTGDQAPPAFQGIGVRIEDDVLITAEGNEVLTAGVPKAIDEVEAVCRS